MLALRIKRNTTRSRARRRHAGDPRLEVECVAADQRGAIYQFSSGGFTQARDLLGVIGIGPVQADNDKSLDTHCAAAE